MENTGTSDRISTLIADKAGVRLEEPATSLDLAALQPLSHSNPFLSAETFSVESFLISRSHTSLSDFRAELRDYHGVLKEELVKLINDDYAAFISLSTDLRGEGPRVEKLKHPLESLRQDTQLSIDELRQVEETIQNKLNERTALREEKARLHVLLKLSETLTRLESLLLITKEDSSEATFGGMPARIVTGSDQNSLETRLRTNRVKHVSRIAAEFNQLLYLVDKAKQDKFAFLSEVQWRIDRVKNTLSSDLNHLFSVLLLAHSSVDSATSSDFDRGRWKSDIKECLSIYDSIGNWREAEEVIRRELITPFIRQTIFPGALVVPHSPLAPRTPFITRGTSFGPMTPKTPYTAFPLTPWPRKAEGNFLSSDFPLSLLDDQNNALAGIYNKILRFTERDIKSIMELAETVSERYRQSTTTVENSDSSSNTPGFEIMSNVIWAGIGRAIMEGLGTTIFAVGRPDDFHENYTTTQNFIAALEALAPSLHAVSQTRNHPVYVTFQRRWQLSAYFQLRWKEIVANLESALTLSLPRKNVIEDGTHDFLIPQTQACYTAMCSCWSEGVYIPEIGHRFWKLTLQILNRYCLWLESFDGHATGTENTNIQSNPTAEELGTLSDVSNEKLAMEDTALYQCGLLISDIKTFERKVMEFWSMHISVILPESEGRLKSPLAVLKQTLARPLDFVPKLGSHIVSILVRRCCENLGAVRSVPSQCRALPSRRMPVAPSPFVADVLRPAKSFFITLSDTVKHDLGSQWIVEIFDAVCTRYASHLAFTKKTEESLRRLKKGKKSAFPLFGSSTSNSSDIDGKEEERVRAQMVLDVAALGDGARDLGVDISQSSQFQELKAMASAVDPPP